MTPSERARVFARTRGRIAQEQTSLLAGTRDEIYRLLQGASSAVTEILASQPSDYQRWSLPQLNAQIAQALEELNQKTAAEASSAAGDAWANGERSIDEPFARAGVSIRSQLPAISTAQLAAIRAFTVDRISNIGLDAANRISAQLGLVVIGAASPSDAIGAVRDILGEHSRARARTIVRTELGRLYETSSQLRKLEAARVLPGLKKQWRKSGKLHPRLHHDLADGQVRAVDEPFVVKPLGRSPVELMYPKDPQAPPSETINCGCTSISYMEHWDVAYRGRTPSPLLEDDGATLADVLARAPQPA